MTGNEVLQKLLEGNRRFAESKQTHPHQTVQRRVELLEGQHPYATVLTCSDSRVVPEIIFDTGLGDLFIIRVAGNVIDNLVLGSIEYAAAHLKTPLVLVLGHTDCGTVTSVVSGACMDAHLKTIADTLAPAVNEAKDAEGDLIQNCVEANARLTAEKLRSSEPVLSELIKAGSLQITPACYDLESGLVAVL